MFIYWTTNIVASINESLTVILKLEQIRQSVLFWLLDIIYFVNYGVLQLKIKHLSLTISNKIRISGMYDIRMEPMKNIKFEWRYSLSINLPYYGNV